MSETDRPVDHTAAFEQAAVEAGEGHYVLCLYVTGATPRSLRAIENAKRICEEHLKGRYTLDVIDLYEQTTLAKDEQIVAVPTLVKRLPAPLRKLVGDLSDTEKILFGLDLKESSDDA